MLSHQHSLSVEIHLKMCPLWRFNLATWNINGLLPRLDELGHLFYSQKIHSIGLTETRTSSFLTSKDLRLTCTIHQVPAVKISESGPPRGGIILLTSPTSLSYTSETLPKEYDRQNFFQLLRAQFSQNIEVVVIYCSPRMSTPHFRSTITEALSTSTRNTFLMGDFNAHHEAWSS